MGIREIVFGLLDPSFSHAIPDDTMNASGPESPKCVRSSGQVISPIFADSNARPESS